jgi:tRNA modification GTPase
LRADTIAAIATGAGGGIGIVRVSGPAALAVAERVVRPWPSSPQSHRLFRARAAGDQILCVVMPAPASYTGEDTVELHGHGGPLSLQLLLRSVLDAGARPAEPGEFTRRAYLNGRLDLSRAEAVAQVIAARSERALRAAQANLRGAIADAVAGMAERLTALLAELEARIDFPEEQLDFQPTEDLARQARAVHADVERLAGSWRRGRLLVRGIEVALVGAPNVGKSSLLNALLGEERALVTDQPGTTRDWLEGRAEWEGVPIVLIDTAGERDAADPVERRGLELAQRRIAGADVIVRVVDATRPGLDPGQRRAELVALNKMDLVAVAPELGPVEVGAARVLPVSARAGSGLEELRRAVLQLAGAGEGGAEPTEEAVLQSERQYTALGEACAALGRGVEALAQRLPPELPALELRVALDRLGSVSGRSVDAAVLDAIFARFCVGK